MLNNLAFVDAADFIEWALKREVSIPDNDKTSKIHRETVWVVENL